MLHEIPHCMHVARRWLLLLGLAHGTRRQMTTAERCCGTHCRSQYQAIIIQPTYILLLAKEVAPKPPTRTRHSSIPAIRSAVSACTTPWPCRHIARTTAVANACGNVGRACLCKVRTHRPAPDSCLFGRRLCFFPLKRQRKTQKAGRNVSLRAIVPFKNAERRGLAYAGR